MKFDFAEQYRSYSNAELLAIVGHPENFQPDAVAAAQQVLSGRTVSQSDIETAATRPELNKLEKIKNYSNKISEDVGAWVQPLGDHETRFQPEHWYKIVLLMSGVSLALSLYDAIKTLVRLVSDCFTCYLDWFDAFPFLSLAISSLVFYLLVKRRRWGWILLYANYLILTIGIIPQVIAYNTYSEATDQDFGVFDYISVFSFNHLLYITGIILLGRKDVRELFNATVKTRTDTIYWSVLFVIFAFGLFYLFLR